MWEHSRCVNLQILPLILATRARGSVLATRARGSVLVTRARGSVLATRARDSILATDARGSIGASCSGLGVGMCASECGRDCGVSRAGPKLFYWPKQLYPFLSSTVFLFLFFLSIGWYCRAGVFGLMGSKSLSLSALHSRPYFNQ